MPRPHLAAALVSALALAACAGPPPAPQNFPPLDYSYLPPIVLNVANVSVVNQYVPDPNAGSVLANDPETPVQALTDVLNRRLVAGGAPGNATITIVQASIVQDGDMYDGAITVRVDVQSGDGLRSGFTEASVTHSAPMPDDDSQIRGTLYGLTKSLMDQINVQLQYQLQQNLGTWISYNNGAAPAPVNAGGSGGIQAAPLTTPVLTSPNLPVAPTPTAAPATANPVTAQPPQGVLGTLPVAPPQTTAQPVNPY